MSGSGRYVSLWIHDTTFSTADVVVNRSLFARLDASDVLELTWTPKRDANSKPGDEKV